MNIKANSISYKKGKYQISPLDYHIIDVTVIQNNRIQIIVIIMD